MIKTKLNQVIQDYKMIGYHFEAIDTLTNPKYKKEYDLGRRSVHMACEYGHTFSDLLDAEYFVETGHCPKCESVKEDL